MFANSACACASAVESISDVDPHAQHQMEGGAADVENPLCLHQECEDCESLSIGAFPERDANLAGFAKSGLDDDVVWIEANAANFPRPLPLLAVAGPPLRNLFRRAETPVRRADLLLD